MSDEEKKVIERIDYIQDFIIENGQYNADVNDMQYFSKVLNLIEKQSKEIEELSDKLTKKICKGVEEEILEEYRQTIISKNKEIEELKEKNRQSKMRIVQLENEITARIEDVNKYFTPNDKIKAKIEEVKDGTYDAKIVLQSLLEKE